MGNPFRRKALPPLPRVEVGRGGWYPARARPLWVRDLGPPVDQHDEEDFVPVAFGSVPQPGKWRLMRDEDHWLAIGPDFISEMESPIGSGLSPEGAVEELRKRYGAPTPLREHFVEVGRRIVRAEGSVTYIEIVEEEKR